MSVRYSYQDDAGHTEGNDLQRGRELYLRRAHHLGVDRRAATREKEGKSGEEKEKGPEGPCLGKLGLPCEVLLPLLSAGPESLRAARSSFARSRTVLIGILALVI